MKIDADWWRHHAGMILLATALLCFVAFRDPHLPADWSHRAGVALGVLSLLWHILFPHAQPLGDYLRPLAQPADFFDSPQPPVDPAKEEAS